MTYAALHDELENDPLARGYSEMTDGCFKVKES